MTSPSAEPTPIQIGRPAPGHEFESMPTLRLIEDRFAQLLSGEFSHTFGAHIEVKLVGTDSKRWGELRGELGAQECCYNLLELDGLGGLGALVMTQELFFGLLELLLGDGAKSGGKFGHAPKTAFSSVENRLLRRITHAFGRCMEQAWRPIVPTHITYLRTEMKADHISLARTEELVMASTFSLSIEGAEHDPTTPLPLLTLVMPLRSVSSHRGELAAGSYDRQVGAPKAQGWGDRLSQAMAQVEVPLAAELGRALLGLEQLMGMQVGQVIRLDRAPQDLTMLSVGGQPKFFGEVVVHHGNLAISITDVLSHGDHDDGVKQEGRPRHLPQPPHAGG